MASLILPQSSVPLASQAEAPLLKHPFLITDMDLSFDNNIDP